MLFDDLIRPVNNAAEVFDVGIAQINQFHSGLAAAVAGAAIDEDLSIEIGEFIRRLRANGLIWKQNRSINVTIPVFGRGANIDDDDVIAFIHNRLGFFS